jgi:hypothetical protein
MFIVYLHAKSHISNSSSSIVIDMKPKGKENFRMTAMLLFYILQKECLSEVAYFSAIY